MKKWFNLAACGAGAVISAIYFSEDKMFLAVMWLLASLIDGLMFVVDEVGL